MGLLSSLNTGVTGLRASGDAMNVVSNNIANANTVGFKNSRAEFQDLLSRSLKGIDGGDQIGSGVKLAHVTGLFTQGNISRTESITDVALNGNGFFAIEAPFGRGYTRDGQFHFNKTGELVNGDGYRILGFQATESGEITNKKGPIQIGSTTIPATATTEVNLDMNLDSRDKIMQFDPENPNKTSSYNNSITVYDNIGTAHVVTVYFNKSADNTWEYHAMVDGEDAADGEAGKPVEMANGTLRFNDKGQLQEEAVGMNSFNFTNGAKSNQQITFDFGESITEGGNGALATTQYGSDSTIARHTQNGSTAATLGSLSFNDDGVLSAVYTNGETRSLAQLAVAKFENNEGLFRVGKNLFKESRKSGQGALGKPGHDGRGEVLAKSIELSNVDMAEEFINLMNSQRNFQANTKTISTADKMLQEILNLKR